MPLPADTFTSYAAIGNREDLSNVIYNVSPTDKPFLTSIDTVDATSTLHEWQTDVLDDPGANARLEGNDAVTTASTPTVRLNNICQISDKVPRVTGTQQAIVSAGRRDELAYQIYKATLALGRDIEKTLTSEVARVSPGDDTTARVLGALESWYETNVSRGSGGSSGGGGTTAPTDGTLRPYTENLLKTVIGLAWDNGGNPDMIMPGRFNKQVGSTFTGNATRMKTAEDGRLVATIDVYQSDFGDLEIRPNRFSRGVSTHVLQTDMWAIAYLRTPRISSLAKTGDSERKQVISEYTLVSRNEKASGIVADLTTS